MRMIDIIAKKRDNMSLTKEEINFFVNGYVNDEIPDYQVSSLLMAIYFNGMSEEELADLTTAMVDSGDTIDLAGIAGIKVDKHSTGGVGDTTTLVIGPLVAALGVPVAKMSGRGLGHTGGTLDKLESVPGFHIELSEDDFVNLVNKHHIALIGQSGNLTPADKKLYALRDVTATVNSIPLIASSIMSKKIAAGADKIVLDVKVGDGAFMKTLEDAERLAKHMVAIGNNLGRETIAIISSMEEPLGYAVGNALEVKEAIDTLSGNGPDDLTELSLELAANMVVLGGKASTLDEAKEKLQGVINSGEALETLKTMLKNQGGDESVVDNPSQLPQAKHQVEVHSSTSGYVESIGAEDVGVLSSMLGAGRQTKDDEIDLSVGIVLHKKIGDKVEKGDVLATLYANTEDVSKISERLVEVYKIGDEEKHIDLIKKIVTT